MGPNPASLVRKALKLADEASDQVNAVGQAGPATRGQVRRKARASGQIRSESPGPLERSWRQSTQNRPNDTLTDP